jgi:hypothetical protein
MKLYPKYSMDTVIYNKNENHPELPLRKLRKTIQEPEESRESYLKRAFRPRQAPMQGVWQASIVTSEFQGAHVHPQW